MMKKALLVILVSLFLLSVTTPAYCDDALRKLGRGISNCLTCYMEIISQVSRTNNSDGPTAALTYGLLKGFAMTGFRAVVGVYEIATFPLPIPRYYKPILTSPEFFLEEKSW